MQATYLELSYLQVGIATLLILINGAVSLLLKLGLERRLLWAALRTVTQLLLVGLVLEWVFDLNLWYGVVALMLAMALVASIAAVQRSEYRYPGIWLDSFVSVWASSWLIAAVALVFSVIVGVLFGSLPAGRASRLDPMEALRHE